MNPIYKTMDKIPNFDKEAGIHYGVISQNSLMPEALSDIFHDSRDLSYEAAVEEAKHNIMQALDLDTDEERRNRLMKVLGDIMMDRKIDGCIEDILDLDPGPRFINREKAWEIVEQPFNDYYQCDDHEWLYEKDGYVLSKCLITDIFISKSPFFTYARECSPCVPNAGNLDGNLKIHHRSGLKSYCLGHDWFEDHKAPYLVFSVKTGKEVWVREVRVGCPNCKGTGKDTVKRLARVRGVTEKSILAEIEEGTERFLGFERYDMEGVYVGTFTCFRCAGAGHYFEKVEEEI